MENKLTQIELCMNKQGNFDCTIVMNQISIHPLLMIDNLLSRLLNEEFDEFLKEGKKNGTPPIHGQAYHRLQELRNQIREEIVRNFPMWVHFISKH
jgi:hypothetical protein